MTRTLADATYGLDSRTVAPDAAQASSPAVVVLSITSAEGRIDSTASTVVQSPIDQYHFQENWITFAYSLFPKGRSYNESEESIFDKAIRKHYSKR